MTSSDLIEAFGRLKTGTRSGQRLPHKPLLVLLALGRWAKGDRGSIPFAEVEKQLAALLQAYGPPGAGNPREPFWRLRRDGVWELGGTEHLDAPEAGSPPGLKELRAGVTGQFSQEVRQALEADPKLVNGLARSVLEAHFPPSLQPDIADATGLDLAEPAPLAPATARKKARDGAFRDRVLVAYGNRCALCRVKLHLGPTPFAVGVEAAHIRWFAYDGPDHVTNGLALCAFHHKAFDLGAFTVQDDLTVSVSEEVHGDGEDVLLKRTPLRVESPACQEDRPKPEFLTWHRDEVFRGRVRS